MDREGKDPLDLLDELQNKLKIHVRPLSWPISHGASFKGVYNLYRKELNLFEASKTHIAEKKARISDLLDPQLDRAVGEVFANKLREDVQLVNEVFEPFDGGLYRDGLLAPVFFGSAINNFGVLELLETFLEIAPEPSSRETLERNVLAAEPNFSGFIFKIHANLDPNHRDRVAFLKVCSGKFERNKFYWHTRLSKKLRFSNPTSFMANEKTLIDEAFPGDVIGLFDSGVFKIGDTLTEGEMLHFKGIPSFSPEIFREVENRDPFKTKQLEKGIQQLTEEGVAQLFIQQPGNRKIVGTVGELQFDVIKFRLEHEYGAKCEFRPLSYTKACWVTADTQTALDQFITNRSGNIAYDKEDRPVYFSESDWMLKMMKQNFSAIHFHMTSEFDSAKSEIELT
jgi:peptide chain release factor 3